jgi:hypothetical protein
VSYRIPVYTEAEAAIIKTGYGFQCQCGRIFDLREAMSPRYPGQMRCPQCRQEYESEGHHWVIPCGAVEASHAYSAPE